MTNPCDLSATQLAAQYRAGAISPVEVTQAVLARAEATQKTLNAFCFLAAEPALAAARQSGERWRRGTPIGPLDGVPVSVKDNIQAAGMPTRYGSRAPVGGLPSAHDSPAVARLREAGAVIFGKTTLPDFAHKIVTDSPLTGITRNPWNPDRTPGGSSGGASAAIAAGIGPLALGTDGGGSIRVPAAFTGIFGFKPSFGRVPHHPRGAYAPVSHVGPMCRTVADAAVMMQAITRPDRRDWCALPADTSDYAPGTRGRLDGVRIGYSESLGLQAGIVAPEVQQAIRRAANHLSAAGAIVESAEPESLQRSRDIHGIMWTSLSARLARKVGDRRNLLDPSLLRLVEIGESLPREALIDALLDRIDVGAEVAGFFDRFSLLISPVFPTVAPRLEEFPADNPPIPLLTSWCNQVGLPAASIPCGTDAAGMPIGMHIVGGRFADATVLAACQTIEDMLGIAPRPS